MDFSFTDEQIAVRDTIAKLCEKYDDAYWLARDTDGEFPEEFIKDIADGGWLGIAMPEEYGGSGLGVTEAALMMQTIAQTGAGFSGCSAIHMNIFGPHPLVVHGTDEQRNRLLPRLIKGEDRTCFGVTEANAGLDTTRIETKAVWDGEKYIINGQKMWTSTAQSANKILLLARTAPRDEGKKPMDGITLFYTDFDRKYCDAQVIEKMGRKAVDSNATFFDNLPVPESDRVGEEGKGFYYLLDGINPERILVAAEAVGLGRAALRKAVAYAKERVVFDRPIGMNQAIQHPLAVCWANLEAADAMVWKAASMYDSGKACGAEANAAKYLAAEACFKACEQSVMTHGGMGYAKEFHVERYLRESFIARIAPVSREMILNYIGQHVLELPRSY
ncbi:MAG: acyl-CoA/acyl-ACP dehydrogenase [Alphaproteobacteria bacterium]|jgi:acyl-CoA dehydrogenase|nr:acyl-CoA/acyl-ACP dehydrogenase [Alphaproteobacteria bacterium]